MQINQKHPKRVSSRKTDRRPQDRRCERAEIRGLPLLFGAALVLFTSACGGGDRGGAEESVEDQPTVDIQHETAVEERGLDGNPSSVQDKQDAETGAPAQSPYLDAPPLTESPVYRTVLEAQVLAKSGRLDEALRLLQKARGEAPGQPEVALLMGQVLVEQSKIEMGYVTTDRELAAKGIQLILGVAEARPKDVPTLLILGSSYCKTKDTASARPVLESVLALDPGNLNARRLLAAILYENGYAAQAEELLPPLESVADKDHELLKLWGMILEDQDRFEEARVVYERAVKGSPFEHRMRFKLASILATLGLEEEADAALEAYSVLLAQKGEAKALEDSAAKAEEPQDLWIQAGVARLGLDDKKAALRNFGRAVRADPSNAEALTWLGVTHAKQRSLGEAKGALMEAVRLAPESLKAHRALGEVLLARKEYDAALAEFELALGLAPQPAEGQEQHPEAVALKALLERARAAKESQG